VIRGTGFWLPRSSGLLAGGGSTEAVLDDYHDITGQDVEAAREFMVLDVNP
jgi:uncharacterized protein (DUF433 family)